MTVQSSNSEIGAGSGLTMARRIRWIALAMIAAALFASAFASASTTDGGAKNVVIAQARTDGASKSRSSVQVAPVGGNTVGAENLAVAKSTDCRNCHSYAIAAQAVLVTSNPTTVAPHNLASASNAGCTSCSSYAYAYQYVVSTGGPARLSTAGRAALHDIRNRIAAVTASKLGPYEMTIKLDALTARFKSVIDNNLIASGGNPNGTTTRNVRLGP